MNPHTYGFDPIYHISITPPRFMKFCPVVPEICRRQVHASRKERIRIIKIIIRNRAKTISPPDLIICYLTTIFVIFFSFLLRKTLKNTIYLFVVFFHCSSIVWVMSIGISYSTISMHLIMVFPIKIARKITAFNKICTHHQYFFFK